MQTAFQFFLLTMLLLGTGAFAQLPENLMLPCERREANLELVRSTLTDDVSFGCRDAIRRASELCFGPTAGGDIEAIMPNGLMDSAAQSATAYETGAQRYQMHATGCDDERANVATRCREMTDGLSQAIQDNNNLLRPAIELSVSTRRDHPLALSRHQEVQDLSQIDRDINLMKRQTIQASATAQRGLRQQVQCLENHALIYTDARNQAAAVVASTSGQSPDAAEGSADVGLSAVVQERSIEVTNRVAVNGVDRVASRFLGPAASPVLQALGRGTSPAANAIVGSQGSTVALYTGVAETVGEFVLSPRNALRLTGGSILLTVLEASPAGLCSEVYIDPVNAYRQNCAVTTTMGAMGNEAAIATLEHE